MRNEKHLLLDDISSQIETFGSFVIVSYKGLKANKANVFRAEVEKVGGNVEMVPKRVFLKAAQAAQIPLEINQLTGHITLVFAGQQVFETPKLVNKLCKENGDTFEILGGKFEGKLCSAEQVIALSELPSQDEMRAQFLGTLEAPLSQTLAVMDALLTSLPHCLENKCKKEANL